MLSCKWISRMRSLWLSLFGWLELLFSHSSKWDELNMDHRVLGATSVRIRKLPLNSSSRPHLIEGFKCQIALLNYYSGGGGSCLRFRRRLDFSKCRVVATMDICLFILRLSQCTARLRCLSRSIGCLILLKYKRRALWHGAANFRPHEDRL